MKKLHLFIPVQYVFIALLCGAAVIFATSLHGIGFNADSLAYVAGAVDLRDEGLLTDSPHLVKFPPLLSMVLLAVNINFNTVIFVYAAILAANVAVFAYSLQMLGIRPWLMLIIVLTIGFEREILWRHSMIMSEPLFLLLMQLAFIMLAKERLAWAAFFAALAPLQRFSGVAVIGTCVLYLFMQRRYIQGIVFGGITILPIALWMIRSSRVGDSAGRQIVYHPISVDHITNGLGTLSFWFLPALIVLFIFIIVRRRAFMNQIVSQSPTIIRISGLFIVIYLAFLVLSISLFDFFTPLDSRILSPVFLTGWMIFAWMIDSQLDRIAPLYKKLASIVLVLLLANYILIGMLSPFAYRQNGIALNEQIEPVYYDVFESLPEATTVYTNYGSFTAVMRMNDEHQQMQNLLFKGMPNKYEAITLIENPSHDEELTAIIQQVESGEAVIAWFTFTNTPFLVSEEALREILPYHSFESMTLFGNTEMLQRVGSP